MKAGRDIIYGGDGIIYHNGNPTGKVLVEIGGRNPTNNRGMISVFKAFFSANLNHPNHGWPHSVPLPANFTPEQARAMFILHALRHVFGSEHPPRDPVTGAEIQNGQTEKDYNDGLLQKCF